MQINPIWQASTQQKIYRELLNAFSHPGTVCDLSSYLGSDHAQKAVLATLLDSESSLADTSQKLSDADWSLLQAQLSPVERAQFIAAEGLSKPEFIPALGSLESPETGATICISVSSFAPENQGHKLALAGPGIESEQTLWISGLDAEWLHQRESWTGNFPLGIDLILTTATKLVALPRTTKIELQQQVK